VKFRESPNYSFAKGKRSRGRVIVGSDVKAIREKANKSQVQFAKAYHPPAGTLRDWEQGRRTPTFKSAASSFKGAVWVNLDAKIPVFHPR
jgi:putative transcriptional regulator